jgi:hypothetical protein
MHQEQVLSVGTDQMEGSYRDHRSTGRMIAYSAISFPASCHCAPRSHLTVLRAIVQPGAHTQPTP